MNVASKTGPQTESLARGGREREGGEGLRGRAARDRVLEGWKDVQARGGERGCCAIVRLARIVERPGTKRGAASWVGGFGRGGFHRSKGFSRRSVSVHAWCRWLPRPTREQGGRREVLRYIAHLQKSATQNPVNGNEGFAVR